MSRDMKNDPLEEQLNATRIKIYELTKGMTSEEQVAYFNKRGEEILKKYGLKTKVSYDIPTQRQPQP